MTDPTRQRWAHAADLFEPGDAWAVGPAAEAPAGPTLGVVGGPDAGAAELVPDPVLDGDGTRAVTLTVPHRPGWRPVVLHHGDLGVVVLHPTAPDRFVPLDVFDGGAHRGLPLDLPDDGVVQVVIVPPDTAYETPGPGAWQQARDHALDGSWPCWWLGDDVR